MKKLIYLLPILLLASCSPQLQQGGWIAPAGLLAGAAWSWYRFLFNKETKGLKGPKLFAIVLTVAGFLVWIVMGLDIL